MNLGSKWFVNLGVRFLAGDIEGYAPPGVKIIVSNFTRRTILSPTDVSEEA